MNHATRSIAATFGFLIGIGGLDHGFFETLQGNTPTPGLFVQAIGPANRMWVYGTEDAFTLIPNFLISGLLVILLSICVMVWSARFVQQKNALLLLALLFIPLFLVGGGVAQVALFALTFWVATQVNHPLTWWRRVLPESLRRGLARVWPFALGIGVLLFLIALEIAIFGFVPGVKNPDLREYICWSSLGIGLVFFLIAIVAGLAHDSDLNFGDK